MNNPVIYVFLNKSLHMSAGKAAAQAAHSAVISCLNSSKSDLSSWIGAIHKTIIVLEGRDENHIRNASKYLNDRGIQTYLIIDEGVNEIDPHTVTAMATKILDKDDENVIKSLCTFNLYKDKVKLTMEFEK